MYLYLYTTYTVPMSLYYKHCHMSIHYINCTYVFTVHIMYLCLYTTNTAICFYTTHTEPMSYTTYTVPMSYIT